MWEHVGLGLVALVISCPTSQPLILLTKAWPGCLLILPHPRWFVEEGLLQSVKEQKGSSTLASPLSSSGKPRRHAGRVDGPPCVRPRRRRERAYSELLRSQRCRRVVLAIEVGGRWSPEACASSAASLVRKLAPRRSSFSLQSSPLSLPVGPPCSRLPPTMPLRSPSSSALSRLASPTVTATPRHSASSLRRPPPPPPLARRLRR